ncbi:MAG: NAD(P)/FAD-dependent oxidoreductase [Ktedonobacteraceae bacterium]|nr:NAD(P)/FAD-dependent oxidoreductase [Ktedonobacteraceae bacterium]
MNNNDPAVVIGCGPYGLSVAAHLQARGIPTIIFGKPMEFWAKMPPKMYLKSFWSALSLYDPDGKYSLKNYGLATGITKQEPVPLQTFLDYGRWFQQHAVPDIDQTYVKMVTADGKRYHVELEDGRSLKASAIIVAAGVAALAHIPKFAAHLPSEMASHSQEHSNFSAFRGKRVVVIGSGQSALESAALLHEAQAEVELIARGPVRWIQRTLYKGMGPLKRVFYPPSDVGPPGVNWLVANQMLFRRFPTETRQALDARAVRPSGARWLRPRVDGIVPITQQTTVTDAKPHGEQVQLTLSDGSTREVDHIVLGTGYAANVHAFNFIDKTIRDQVQTHNGSPNLNEWFESSVPHLYFTGAMAGYNFGPLCRFVVGAKAPARQITRHIAREKAR